MQNLKIIKESNPYKRKSSLWWVDFGWTPGAHQLLYHFPSQQERVRRK